MFLFGSYKCFGTMMHLIRNWNIFRSGTQERDIFSSVGSGILCTFLQRSVAKLKENGTTTNIRKKDQVAKEEKALHPFRKFFYEFC
jgi:hypothetical protein